MVQDAATQPHVAMVAGEASGDLLAGLMLDGLRRRWPTLTASGIGGPQMAQRGFDAWWPSDKLAVHGYSLEVLRRVRELLGIRSQLRDRLVRHKPGVFIGVDAPDFNLGLEAALRAGGVKTVHFVCPSIWAWRANRIEKIRRAVDHMLCVFPFEPALLAQHGIEATYVGHPLASVIPLLPDKAAARARLGLRAEDSVVAILPGSRRSEVRYLARRFFEAAEQIRHARPATKFVVPAVPQLAAAIREAAQAVWGDAAAQRVHIVEGQSHTVLAACDATLIASGTATLEAALFKRPMVIAYRMHWLSYQLMRHRQLQPWVGLPNILCGEFVVPELLQQDATAEGLARETLRWLDADAATIAGVQQRFAALHAELQRDTAELAVHAIEKILAT
jgi:lipid-A-disaccharide synthase